ncbi:MAG: nitrate reductase [Deltaproteobacteria bacterium]|nr:nitrate reductase [Deltaproteobacteria bacterium]
MEGTVLMELLLGPVVWIAFAVFLLGSLYRLVSMLLLAKKEKVVLPTYDLRYGLRSVMHWIVPFNARNMRLRPLFTVVSFAFHFCLLVTPLLVMGHAVLWERAWGIRWWSLPPGLADAMALVVVFAGVFYILRRISAPEVRYVTDYRDYLLVVLVISPFATGFVAHQQWLDPEIMTVLHILCGAAWLIAIPFTRLSHMFWWVFTRAFMGSESGSVRHARDW